MYRIAMTVGGLLLFLPVWESQPGEPLAEETASQQGLPAPRGCTDGGDLKDGVCSKGQPVYLPDGKAIGYLRTTETTTTSWPDGTDKSVKASLNLQIVVLPDGTVTEILPMLLRVSLPGEEEQRMSPTGSKYGFVKAASDAVSQWRYKPPTLDGKPVAVYGSVCLNFGAAAADESENGSDE